MTFILWDVNANRTAFSFLGSVWYSNTADLSVLIFFPPHSLLNLFEFSPGPCYLWAMTASSAMNLTDSVNVSMASSDSQFHILKSGRCVASTPASVVRQSLSLSYLYVTSQRSLSLLPDVQYLENHCQNILPVLFIIQMVWWLNLGVHLTTGQILLCMCMRVILDGMNITG